MDADRTCQKRANMAVLESEVDLIEAELRYINGLLLEVGVPDGIDGLKDAIEEVLRTDE